MTMPNQPALNPKAMEAWFTLMAEAMRGTQQAQQAFDAYAQMSGTPEEWRQWMSLYMPLAAAPPTSPEAMDRWVEEWQRMMGVVPRQRYLDLLASHDELQHRLQKAEETIAGLRALLTGKDVQEDAAHQVVDIWTKMLDDTLKTQAEWMQRWAEPKAADPDTDSHGSTAAPPDVPNSDTG